jgi:voltage-gated potassium channel
MNEQLSADRTHHVSAFQFAVLVLSIVTLGMIVADTFFTLPPEVVRVLQGLDFIACMVFLIDFIQRFRQAESKLQFMKLGWIDLLSSIPNLEMLRVGRFVRVFRVLRLLRGVRSVQRLAGMLFHHTRRGGVTSILLTTFLVIGFSSIAILLCERDPDGNIKTAGDAVWWTITTMTTVGYGDRYPVTFEGRVLAMGLMLAGVGLFGVVSGMIASVFVGKSDEQGEILAELRNLRVEVEKLRQQQQTAVALRGTGALEP